MPAAQDDAYQQVRATLTAWHATHPRATFAEIEAAVETQLRSLRTQVLAEQLDAGFVEERPQCQRCGATMEPRARSTKTVTIRGDDAVPIERPYVVCPQCGAGLFPPG
jgi:YgiT-type zinc finger domain-containing protein